MKNSARLRVAFAIGLSMGGCVQAWGATILEDGVPVQVTKNQLEIMHCDDLASRIQAIAELRDDGLSPQQTYRRFIPNPPATLKQVKHLINDLYFGQMKQAIPDGMAEELGFVNSIADDCMADINPNPHHWKPLK